jgi:REP element-mobilizing transposase RayT
VQDTLLHFDGERYDLIAWCVMPNHVHVVMSLRGDHTLNRILDSWKTFTARNANQILGRSGERFWQAEYFDRLVRDDEHLRRVVKYVYENPQRAGLAQWEWVGVKADLL